MAIVKLLSGSISMPKLFPDIPNMVSIWNLFTVVPVLVTAYICHYNGMEALNIIFSALHGRLGTVSIFCKDKFAYLKKSLVPFANINLFKNLKYLLFHINRHAY